MAQDKRPVFIVEDADGHPANDHPLTRDAFAQLLRKVRRSDRASVARTHYAITGQTWYAIWLSRPVHHAHCFRVGK